jgi:hypothetical protein
MEIRNLPSSISETSLRTGGTSLGPSPPSPLDVVHQTVIESYIPSLVTMLSRSAYRIEIYNDSLYGTVAEIVTDLSARDALEPWLKLIDHMPMKNYGVILSVKWLGENNVSGDELISYMVKTIIKSKIGPKALPGFNATRIVREVRE